MSNHEFTLYVDSRFLSPYAMSAFVALTEKGVPFELKKISLAQKEHLQEDYARLSMTRRIPTLAHGAFRLSESSAIAEYLDDTLPAPGHFRLYPADARDRATARQIQAWLRSDLMPLRVERDTEVIFLRPVKKPLSVDASTAAATLLSAAETWLRPGASNLFGDDWCIADTDLALMLNRLAMNGDKVPARLADYVKHQWQRPSVQTWVTQSHQVAAQAASQANA